MRRRKELLREIYETLLRFFGPQHWWPAETPLEVVIGAVLTQNTAWRNVAVAIANLKRQGLLDLEAMLASPPEEIKAAIRPSGVYNVKYERLRNVLAFMAEHGGIAGAAARPAPALRQELLAVPGVGPETADSILLYALEKPFFVIDRYTRRLLARLGYTWAEKAPYAEVQNWFMQQLAPSITEYNEYHALIVRHGKEHCLKRPVCAGCPLGERCPSHTRNRPLQPPAPGDV